MNKKIISIIQWFFGALFVARGVTLLSDSFLGGIFMVLAGTLLLPIIQKKLVSFNSSLQPKWLSAGAFVLLIGSGMSLQASEEQSLKNGKASPELLARDAERKARSEEQQRIEAEREATKLAEKERRNREREARDRAIAMQVDAEIALKNFLKDPESAQIRNQNGMCGEVNSKNSFGGYTGFKRFIASPAIVAIDGENIESSEFQTVWEKFCT